ncbi:domain of Kin17 curved DNA-binding protein-domain-containing protein, partial [Catenaria anguillulae PL171]
MGKHDFMSAKAIANRIKAKGLNKLRWYCQPCNKSCRDENGYKCHINTEAHHRAMMLFAENAQGMLTDYSRQFKTGFLDILRTRYGTRRVYANQVYNEYIADRHHIHMNATCWTTLSAFVKYLGREGEVKVEEDERGWYITYIDRSPETLKRMEKDAKREREEREAEGEEQRLIEEQIRRAHAELEKRTMSSATAAESTRAHSPSPALGSDVSVPAPSAAGTGTDDSTRPSSPSPASNESMAPAPAALPPAAAPPRQPIKLGFGLKPPAKPAASLTTVASGGVDKKKSLASLMSKSTALAAASAARVSSVGASNGLALHALIEEDRERQRRKEEAIARRAAGSSGSNVTGGTSRGGKLAFGGRS